MSNSTLTVHGRHYTQAELNAAWSERNNEGEGFADEGLRSDDVPLWQSECDSDVSVIIRGDDTLLISSSGWAVIL